MLFRTKALAQVFSGEICEISKITFFTEHLWVTASESMIFNGYNLKSGILVFIFTWYRAEQLYWLKKNNEMKIRRSVSHRFNFLAQWKIILLVLSLLLCHFIIEIWTYFHRFWLYHNVINDVVFFTFSNIKSSVLKLVAPFSQYFIEKFRSLV